ncbi:hypothetical protein C8J57DRAFT_1229573 [Mycena rebaudengoi]|nr:hypothetical protein C8J57DRAFT_1229573 [Mycena rebaudengoi]
MRVPFWWYSGYKNQNFAQDTSSLIRLYDGGMIAAMRLNYPLITAALVPPRPVCFPAGASGTLGFRQLDGPGGKQFEILRLHIRDPMVNGNNMRANLQGGQQRISNLIPRQPNSPACQGVRVMKSVTTTTPNSNPLFDIDCTSRKVTMSGQALNWCGVVEVDPANSKKFSFYCGPSKPKVKKYLEYPRIIFSKTHSTCTIDTLWLCSLVNRLHETSTRVGRVVADGVKRIWVRSFELKTVIGYGVSEGRRGLLGFWMGGVMKTNREQMRKTQETKQRNSGKTNRNEIRKAEKTICGWTCLAGSNGEGSVGNARISSLEAGASPHTSRYTSFGDLTRVREIPGGDGGTGSVRECGVWWKVEVGTIKRESEEDGERIDTPRHLVAYARNFRWLALGRRGWDESMFNWYALRTTVCVVHVHQQGSRGCPTSACGKDSELVQHDVPIFRSCCGARRVQRNHRVEQCRGKRIRGIAFPDRGGSSKTGQGMRERIRSTRFV